MKGKYNKKGRASLVIHQTIDLTESSIIDRMVYDLNTKMLQVSFFPSPGHEPRTYRYFDVPEGVVRDMCSAKSVGSFFVENIKEEYSYEEVL